jgi:hypothetical protein
MLFTVEGAHTETNLRWFETYKDQMLLQGFDQEEIYLAVTAVVWLER